MYTSMYFNKSPVATTKRTKHICDLNLYHEDYLPRPAPYSGLCVRIGYHLQQWMIISQSHHNAQFYFRSQSAILREKFRHLTNPAYQWTIHPLSKISIVRSAAVFPLLTLIYVVKMFKWAFMDKRLPNQHSMENSYISITFHFIGILLGLDIIICFFMGYIQDNQMVLDLKKIRIKYLKSWFLIDFIPFVFHITAFVLYITSGDLTIVHMLPMHFLRFLRLKTMIEHRRNCLQFFRFEESTIRVINLFLNAILIIHWGTCTLYTVPLLTWMKTKAVDDSMVLAINMGREDEVFNIYLECFVGVTCHFLSAGKGTFKVPNPSERIILAVICIIGLIYNTYAIAVMLEMFGTMHISENKYTEVFHQLHEYMIAKKLPTMMKNRMEVYYKHRFRRHFFCENTILSALSEHLRCEIRLCDCRHLIDRVGVFQGVNRDALGAIISMLKYEVYLQNDYLINHSLYNSFVFFVSHGTIMASYNGLELSHLTDGSHVGEYSIITNNISPYDIIAIEITEVFYLAQAQLLWLMKQFPEVGSRFENSCREKGQFINEIFIKRRKQSMQVTADDILNDLKMGSILARPIANPHKKLHFV